MHFLYFDQEYFLNQELVSKLVILWGWGKEIKYLNYGLLISPRVFKRIACFFKFYANDDATNVMPVSIEFLIKMLETANTIDDFEVLLNKSLTKLLKLSPADYAESINLIKS